MKKLMTAGLFVILLSRYSIAVPDTSESSLAGEWICRSASTEDKLTLTLNADGSGLYRTISTLEISKEMLVHYLNEGKIKWQSKGDTLALDFISHSIVPAYSQRKSEPFETDKELQWLEKEKFYYKGIDHVEVQVELKNGEKELILGKDNTICHRVMENDKDIK